MKNIVITGSTQGIGLAMAKAFLESGCKVTLSGRRSGLSEKVDKELSALEGEYIYVRCDVREKDSIQSLWNESVKHWGHIDIWINNAGQNTPYKYSWVTDKDCLDNVISTNLNGMIYGCQIAVLGMLSQGHGAIYSMEGLGSNNMIQVKTIVYGTTKHALTYYMKGLAKELEGTGVIAGRLAPGMMLTDFITKNQEGEVSEVLSNKEFIKIFNILGDQPETVAEFLVSRMLRNTKNNQEITWLTRRKAAWRFMTAPLRKNRLLKAGTDNN